MNLSKIKDKVNSWEFRLSEHAEKERNNDGITIDEIYGALLNAELLEDYPEDKRGHSCLLLGFDSANKPIHIVCALDRNDIVIMITIYIPSLPKWKNPRERNITSE